MANLQLQPATTQGKNRFIRASFKVDMTPLVDLGFLLITFFVFTSSISKAGAATMYIPADGEGSKVPESVSLTVLMCDNNKAFVYSGIWEKAVTTNNIHQTDYDVRAGIGKFIRMKKQELQQLYPGKDTLMLLIKPTASSTLQNLVDVLDEVSINDIKRYAIMQPTEKEKKFVAGKE